MNIFIKTLQLILKPFLWSWIWNYQPFKYIYKIINYIIDVLKPNQINIDTIYWFKLQIDTRKVKTSIDTLILWGYYEKMESDIIFEISQKKPKINFIDIGANIWYYSILVSMNKESWTIYSFEPLSITFKLLKENIKLNNIGDNIELINKWVWLSNKNVDIFYDEKDLLLTSTDTNHFYKHQNKETIEIIKLDSQLGYLKNIWLIKIDIEWEELNAIKWMKKLIERDKPIIILEYAFELYNSKDKKSFFEILIWQWYILFEINEANKELTQLINENLHKIYNKYTNLLCIHKSKEDECLKILKKFL